MLTIYIKKILLVNEEGSQLNEPFSVKEFIHTQHHDAAKCG